MTRKPHYRWVNRAVMLWLASMLRLRIILSNGKFWSGILAAASFSRGTAFIERPPIATTVASGAIEAFITYRTWGWILIASAIGIILSQMHKSLRNVGVVSHLVSLWAYGTFALSTALASLYTGQSWSNLGLFATQSILHVACAIYIGDEIARSRQGAKVE